LSYIHIRNQRIFLCHMYITQYHPRCRLSQIVFHPSIYSRKYREVTSSKSIATKLFYGSFKCTAFYKRQKYFTFNRHYTEDKKTISMQLLKTIIYYHERMHENVCLL
jgi:hypothetical protein